MTLVLSALLLCIVFALTWWTAFRLENLGIVDVVWGLAFTPVVLLYSYFGDGWEMRRLIVTLLLCGWSLRLGTYLARRVAAHHPHEDVRYAALREKWQAHLRASFFVFFMAQGVLIWLLLLPVYLISQNATPHFSIWEYAGIFLWALGMVGEAIADRQLARFKALQPPSGICKIGLWRYSRHPNYFFQSLLWWGLFLMALPAQHGFFSILAPLAMLHFLLNVTGIPLTEKLAIQKRGAAYLQYQRETSAFIPWFTKADLHE